MTDQELIELAHATRYTKWQDIEELIQQARLDQTKEQLRDIMMMKYHQEEASVYNI